MKWILIVVVPVLQTVVSMRRISTKKLAVPLPSNVIDYALARDRILARRLSQGGG